MVSKSITVRFKKNLYHRVKERDTCTSRLIREAVREYLDKIDRQGEIKSDKEDEDIDYNIESDPDIFPSNNWDQVSYDGKKTKIFENNYDELNNRNIESSEDNPEQLYNYLKTTDQTLFLMDELKNKISQLDDEMKGLITQHKDRRNRNNS